MALSCQICRRASRGFGFRAPKSRNDFLGGQNPSIQHETQQYRFCSMKCQSLFNQLISQEIALNKTDLEKKAEAAVLIPLGDYVADIGLSLPLSTYSKEQITGLVTVVIDTYHDALQRLTKDEIPF